MLGMKNHFDISGSIEIREVDIAGVACIVNNGTPEIIAVIILKFEQGGWSIQQCVQRI